MKNTDIITYNAFSEILVVEAQIKLTRSISKWQSSELLTTISNNKKPTTINTELAIFNDSI